MAISGSAAAFAAESTAGGGAASSASADQTVTYAMDLSPASAAVGAGGETRTTISFRANDRLYGAAVNLSIRDLPCGVTASFSPPAPRVGGTSTLTLSASRSIPAGAFAITVDAIINFVSSDPIGTSTVFDLTINAR
jgi:hypothetical protein